MLAPIMFNFKKISWALLYLAAFIPAGFALYFFSEKSMLPALAASLITASIYTLLVIKNLRFLSPLSFFTFPFIFLLTLGIVSDGTGEFSTNAFAEKASLLTISLFSLFSLINSVHWAKTKRGFKKLISLIFIFLSVLILVIFGIGSPTFYQNFVYTRANILILLLLSIFLIIKKKRLWGILGILLSIGILLLSASMFAEKTYPLDSEEQKKVVAIVDPLAKEMFGYYNKKDYGNFCNHCGFILKNMLEHKPIEGNRETIGPYVYFDRPSNVYRRGGRYGVEYPVKFQNAKDLLYLTFIIENISSDPIVYGFSLGSF